MAFEMRKDQDGVVIVDMIADDVFLEVEPMMDRDFEFSVFVHDVHWEAGLKAMFFDRFPMIFLFLTGSAISGATFDDGSV